LLTPDSYCGPVCRALGGSITVDFGTGPRHYNHQNFTVLAGAAGVVYGTGYVVGIPAAVACTAACSEIGVGATLATTRTAISRSLGPAGNIFGRARLGGSSFMNINANKYLRIGWGWNGNRPEGQQMVFRFAGKVIEAIRESGHIDIFSTPWK
jgi:hypothetical protein